MIPRIVLHVLPAFAAIAQQAGTNSSDAVNAHCAADAANCLLQGCCQTSGHKCSMKGVYTAYCRSASPPASWFGHEITKSTAPNGGETSDNRLIATTTVAVQDGGGGSGDSSNECNRNDAVNANCAADNANCLHQGCCRTSGHKCFMKDGYTAFCRSHIPPASWFGHELRRSTAPNGGKASDDGRITTTTIAVQGGGGSDDSGNQGGGGSHDSSNQGSRNDVVNANCAADTANCLHQGCCKTSGHKCFMKDVNAAFCRSGSPPASWFGHELRTPTTPSGGETSDDGAIIVDEQVQDGSHLGGVASVVSPRLVMAGVAMIFVMGASLLAVKFRRWQQPSSDGRGIPQLLSSHEEDMKGLQHAMATRQW